MVFVLYNNHSIMVNGHVQEIGHLQNLLCDLKEISNFSFRPPSLCTNAYATHGCIDTSNDLFCVILKQNMLYLCKQIKHLFYLFDLSLLKESVFCREGPTNSSFTSTKIGRVTNKQASPET